MVKNTREQRMLKKMGTPESDKFTTTSTTTNNKRRKPQQRHENNGATDNAAAATSPTKTTKRVNKLGNELQDAMAPIRKLHYGSVVPDDDDDDDDDDYEEDDEEAEESETDLLDEDDDDDDEATLLISSDEEEFLETQRISLPELIVKKLLQTTSTTATNATAIPTPKSSAGTRQKKMGTKTTTEQRPEQSEVSTAESDLKPEVAELKKSPIHKIQPKIEKIDEVPTPAKRESPKKARIDDFPMPMLLPKVENVEDDIKQKHPTTPPVRVTTPEPPAPAPTTPTTTVTSEVTASAEVGSAKRRRGRPPKSKLTEANVQVEDVTDKPAKRTPTSPTPDAMKKVAVLGRISFNAPEQTLVYQCTLCNVMFFKELNVYTQHLRTAHQILRYLENPVMVTLPQRKSARGQQDQSSQYVQPKGTKAMPKAAETNEQSNAGTEHSEPNEQPKDDKENILSQLNSPHEQLDREPYCACGLITLYDAGTISLICKYCDCVHTQEELFKKHILMEHQALVTPHNANEKSPTPMDTTPNEDIVDDSNNEMVAPEPSEVVNPMQNGEKRCFLTSVTETQGTESLVATQAPETPPPEESEQEKEKHAMKAESVPEPESLPSTLEESPLLDDNVEPTDLEQNALTAEKQKESSEEQQVQAAVPQVPQVDAQIEEQHVACENQQATVAAEHGDVPHAEEIRQADEAQKAASIPQPDGAQNEVTAVIDKQKPKMRRGRRKRSIESAEAEAVAEPISKRPARRGRSHHSQLLERTEMERKKPKPNQISTSHSTVPNEHKNKPQLMDVEPTLSLTTTVEVTATATATTTAAEKTPTTTIINNEIATTLPANKKRKGRPKQSKQLSPPKEETREDSNTVASSQVHEETNQMQQQQSESTPSPPSPPSPLSSTESSVSTKAAKKGKSSVMHSRKRILIKVQEKNEFEGTNSVEPTMEAEIVDAQQTTNTSKNENDTIAASATAPATSQSSGKPSKGGSKCEICDKPFKKSSRLIEHMRLHTGELPYECETCNKKFRIKARLTEHKMRHLGIRSFKCNVCSLALATKQDLAQHQRYHTGVRPHTCPHCPKAFVRGSDLKIHLRIHTGEKPFVCEVCNQSFRANQNLYVHKKTHLGMKDCRCEFCDKRFMRKIDLRVHMRTHTGEKPYKCEICGRGFSSKFNVRTHIERLHVANANGMQPKKSGRKSNGLRVELERQKELIEELRNQLAQRIKTEEVILQQQQQLLLLPTTPTAITSASTSTTPAATAPATTSKSKSTSIELVTSGNVVPEKQEDKINQQSNQQPISIGNFELPIPMYGMPTAVHMPSTSLMTNTIGSMSSSSSSTSIPSPQLQSQSQSQSQLEKTVTGIADGAALNSANPQSHDISILAVFTTQPHGVEHLNNLPPDSIKATTTPLRLQLPTSGRTSSNKKERKITSYFNVMGQKS